MRTGKAAVLEDYEEPLKIEEIEVDDPGPGEVLVRMAVSGVCHTDEHVITGDLPLPVPMVMGHEGCGTVEAIGTGVSEVVPGDLVVLSWLPSCGTCIACVRGWTGMCRATSKAAEHGTLWNGAYRVHGMGRPLHVMSLTGTLATYAVVPEAGVLRLPQGFPPREAALLGCSAVTGYGAAARTAHISPGSSVTVIGVGGVGVQVIAACHMLGAERIFAVDRFPARLEAARRHGATDLVNAAEVDALTAVLDSTDGFGTDYAFEVVGNPETIAQAFNIIRPGGTAVVVGVAPPHVEVSLNAFAFPSQGKTLTGTWYGGAAMKENALALIEAQQKGAIDLSQFVGDPYPLERVNEAFDALRTGEPTRPLVEFGTDFK